MPISDHVLEEITVVRFSDIIPKPVLYRVDIPVNLPDTDPFANIERIRVWKNIRTVLSKNMIDTWWGTYVPRSGVTGYGFLMCFANDFDAVTASLITGAVFEREPDDGFSDENFLMRFLKSKIT